MLETGSDRLLFTLCGPEDPACSRGGFERVVGKVGGKTAWRQAM